MSRSSRPSRPAFVGGEAGQGVLVHLVLGADRAQLPAQRCELADAHAAVLGDEHRLGCSSAWRGPRRPTATFSASRVLSCHVHLLSLLLGCSLCSEHREERKARMPDDRSTSVHLGWRANPLPISRGTSGLWRATGLVVRQGYRRYRRYVRRRRSGCPTSGRRRLVSTLTPGPIVDDTVILLQVAALGGRRLGPLQLVEHGAEVGLQRRRARS